MPRRIYFYLTIIVLISALSFLLSGSTKAANLEVKDEGVFLDGEFISDKVTYEKALEEGGLQFYTAHTLSQDKKMSEEFMKLFPEIKVVITRAGGGTLNEKMLTEQAAGVLKADVVINSDRNYLDDFKKNGWLRQHTPPSDAKFPDSSKEAGYYYPTGASAMIFAYHSQLVSKEDAPKDWKDLSDPKWKGKLGWQRFGGGAGWSQLCFLRSQLGADIFKACGKNNPIMYTSGGHMANALVSGEVVVAALGLYASYPMKYNNNAPIELVFPESGSPLYISVIGLMEQGNNPNAAKLFLNWYLSVPGQTLLSGLRGQFSLRDDVPSPENLPPLSKINYWIPDPELYLNPELRNEWIKDANEAFGWQ